MPTARELRAMAAARGVAVPPNGPATATKSPKAPSVRPWGLFRSKWEHEYAKRLDLLKAAGVLDAWAYEPTSFLIGVGARYKPDFLLLFADNHDEWHEVKGYRREAAMVRIKAAALAYPAERFVLVTKIKGEWHHTPITPEAA